MVCVSVGGGGAVSVGGGGAVVVGGGATVVDGIVAVVGGGGGADVVAGGATVTGAGWVAPTVVAGDGPRVRTSGWKVMPGLVAPFLAVVVVSVVEVVVVGTKAREYLPCVQVCQTGQSCGSAHCCAGE